MLNYTKTVFVNKPANVRVYVSGAAGTGVIKDGDDSGLSDSLTTAAVPTTKLVVKNSDELWNDANHTIKVVAKTPYVAASPAYATLTLTASTTYRLSVYVRLRNNNNSLMSNNWTFKGKPFTVEFTTGATNPAVGAAKLINKIGTFEYGDKLVKVTGATTTLTLTAADQWTMFMTQDGSATGAVILEKLGTDTDGNDVWAKVTNGITVNNGKEGFGDFAHIVKDLRLPTNANTRYFGVANDSENDDKPAVNGHYTQYTIEYDSERGIGQQSVLGGVATSRTTHVFYVESAATAAFDAAIVAVGAKAFEGALSHTATLGNVTANGLKDIADTNSDGIIKGAELKTT